MTGEVIARKNKKINKRIIKMLQEAEITSLPAKNEDIEGYFLAQDVIDPATGEVLVGQQRGPDQGKTESDHAEKNRLFWICCFIDGVNVSSSLRDTLIMDKISNTRRGHPGDL